jgi:hypothetical protein
MIVILTLIAQLLDPVYAAMPPSPYAQPPLPTVSEDEEVNFEHGPGVRVVVGVSVGVGVTSGHVYAVAVKTRPACVFIKSE